MPQYFEATNQKAIRQYAEIIAMTDDVDKIANYLELSEPALYKSIASHRFGTIDFEEFGELMLDRRLMSRYTEFVTYFLPIDADDRHFRQ